VSAFTVESDISMIPTQGWDSASEDVWQFNWAFSILCGIHSLTVEGH